jgi:hypothetical protein
MLVFLVYVAGSVVGSLPDPVNWALIASCIFLGVTRAPWYFAAIAAALFTIIEIAFGYSWWIETGTNVVSWSWHVIFIDLIIAYLVFWVAAGLRRLFQGKPETYETPQA